jgi:8-amino-3,8-dideoxy-alpha-D-manno-octulosonate transaminase
MKNYFGQYPGGRHLGKEEIKNVTDVIKSKSPYRFSGLNLKMYCSKLENKMAKFVNKKHCLVVNSGTAALHCALHAIGIQKGDEVIVPSYGWSADLMSIVMMAAIPVIVPVSNDVNLDIEKVKKAISKKTRALIVIHMRGYPCNFSKIKNFFKKKKIFIIEDCSQCFGGILNNKRVGNLGDIATMSFQYNKMITSGEGGALITNSKKILNKSTRFHNLGMNRTIGKDSKKTNDPIGPRSIMSCGLNYRMSELTASVAYAQLGKIKKIISGCKKNWMKVKCKLEELENLGYLSFRKIDIGCDTNYAFLGFFRAANISHQELCYFLKKKKIKFHHVDLKDSHHFEIWKHFLNREKIKFRDLTDKKNKVFLNRNYFCEISSN